MERRRERRRARREGVSRTRAQLRDIQGFVRSVPRALPQDARPGRYPTDLSHEGLRSPPRRRCDLGRALQSQSSLVRRGRATCHPLPRQRPRGRRSGARSPGRARRAVELVGLRHRSSAMHQSAEKAHDTALPRGAVLESVKTQGTTSLKQAARLPQPSPSRIQLGCTRPPTRHDPTEPRNFKGGAKEGLLTRCGMTAMEARPRRLRPWVTPPPDPGHPCCRCGCASDCEASAWRRRRSPRLREDCRSEGEGERGWGCRSILTAEGGSPGALLRPASSTNPSAARVSGEVGSRELQRCAHEGVRAASHEPDDLVGAALRPVTGLHQALDDCRVLDAQLEHLAYVRFAQRGVRAHCFPLLRRLRRWAWIPAGIVGEPPRSSDLEASPEVGMTDPQRELHERLAMPEVFVLGRLELAQRSGLPPLRTLCSSWKCGGGSVTRTRRRLRSRSSSSRAWVLAQGSQKSVRGVKGALTCEAHGELLNVFGADGDAVNPHAIDPLQCQLFPRPTSGWPYLGLAANTVQVSAGARVGSRPRLGDARCSTLAAARRLLFVVRPTRVGLAHNPPEMLSGARRAEHGHSRWFRTVSSSVRKPVQPSARSSLEQPHSAHCNSLLAAIPIPLKSAASTFPLPPRTQTR